MCTTTTQGRNFETETTFVGIAAQTKKLTLVDSIGGCGCDSSSTRSSTSSSASTSTSSNSENKHTSTNTNANANAKYNYGKDAAAVLMKSIN